MLYMKHKKLNQKAQYMVYDGKLTIRQGSSLAEVLKFETWNVGWLK